MSVNDYIAIVEKLQGKPAEAKPIQESHLGSQVPMGLDIVRRLHENQQAEKPEDVKQLRPSWTPVA